ncbi:guanine nucleotide-binding protein subunit alpha [Polyrhizophydium stewartii]|uniref:Guanine nucleotide-binding protein subunit alpha n=1 Tax=Polyrhizophydium stewartii TaxID=2732419 RepID=A0ABR4N198_9FUNG|nr:guanine nucleotide-binding protein subunit alpha [Polyrhizophydium stewartii]
MGCGASTEENEETRRNAEIENSLRKERENMRNQVKILLLGAGESGKSTILKQMTLIHGTGYSRYERESYKEIIFSNTIQSIRAVIDAQRLLQIPFSDPRSAMFKSVIESLPNQLEVKFMPPEVAQAIRGLYADAGVRACIERSREYQLNDSAQYYFESIDRISQRDYIPTDQDVLRSRVKTTGITDSTFQVGQLTYRMFDVGGQRSERKKWIHCFENVTAILFLVAISEYDQVLIEDENVNRIHEALILFESICNSRWFTNTSIILFLNKIDLFKQKLPRSPLNRYFPEYIGGPIYENACHFFLEKFVRLQRAPNKQVYPHFTCATDTTQVKFVMSAVNDILMQNSLRESGLVM